MCAAPYPSIALLSWLVQTAITVAPLATPAFMPEGESSKTIQEVAGNPRHEAARRNGSGNGFPRSRRGSSAVIVTLGGVIPTRESAPWAARNRYV